jgi:hypothetical protein
MKRKINVLMFRGEGFMEITDATELLAKCFTIIFSGRDYSRDQLWNFLDSAREVTRKALEEGPIIQRKKKVYVPFNELRELLGWKEKNEEHTAKD